MTPSDASPPDASTPGPDPGGGLKIAGLALLAWALIGIGLRLTSGFEFDEELFVLALLAPAAVGIALSVRALLRSSDKFLSTMGLIINVFLVMGAFFLWISSRGTAP